MSESQKKQTFLHGAALLALATAIVKLIGAFYKIPLKMVIGDQGYGYFVTAYDIYSVLLLISTAGLPVAMSRMISQANATGKGNQVRRVYKTARTIFLALGLASALLMVFGSRFLAEKVLMQPNAAYAIACLGPSALFMGIIATFRGFFQGHGNMRPTSTSQVLEAAFKLIVGLALAFWMMYQFKNVPLAAAGAIMGVTVSCVISTVFLYAKFRPAYNTLATADDVPLSFGATAKGLLAIAIPITIGSAGLQFLTIIEQRLYMGQLLTANGLSQPDADTLKGIYSMTMTIYNMPCAFISPITISVLPAISATLAVGDVMGVRETEESAARVTSLISLPCSVGLFILARPVMALLGGYEGQQLDLAATLMRLLAVCIFLQATIQYSNVVMQAHGFAHIPVINMLSTGVCKLAVVYFLVGNPKIGIAGAPIGAVIGYTVIAILNLLCIRKVVPQKPRLLRNILRSMPPALIMGAAVFFCYTLLDRVSSSRVLLCGVPIFVGVAVYLLCAVLFKSITAADCKLLPKGDKIAKLLKL